ncbi:hypothetical protein GQ53DRAFT_808031 [Thozetella sp. PMI_491]|nr:hypothetical protein GQ53DRAFT_808031 [Thozetella sp. PMI_491]
MTIKDTPQILKRVSLRWLPDPAFEDTDTVALNVGGYFLDLRVTTTNGSLQWSRAGERKRICDDPLTFQWTRIIDSTEGTQTDEAVFTMMRNGDDLESGTFVKDGVPTEYEEIWRDVTGDLKADSSAWILQSGDSTVFLGKSEPGLFGVRKEVYNDSNDAWEVVFEGGAVQGIPRAENVVEVEPQMTAWDKNGRESGRGKVIVADHEYVIRGFAGS